MAIDIVLAVATYPDATSRVGLGQALGLAARFGAGVSAMIQEVDIAPIHNAIGEALIGISQMALDAEARSRERAADLRAWLQERAGRLGVPLETSVLRCRPDGFAEGLVAAARYHDMAAAVVDANDPQRQVEVQDLIFGTGGPVLLLPASDAARPVAEGQSEPLNIVVAWDGSVSAARALRGALPLLSRAAAVFVLTVVDDKAINPGAIGGVEAHLLRHGISAKLLQRTRGSSPIGDTLMAVAAAQQADLLVMGAFGRSRLQEFILGGATRTILQAPRLPVLLAH